MDDLGGLGEGYETEDFPPSPPTSTTTLDLALEVHIQVFGTNCRQTLDITLLLERGGGGGGGV